MDVLFLNCYGVCVCVFAYTRVSQRVRARFSYILYCFRDFSIGRAYVVAKRNEE